MLLIQDSHDDELSAGEQHRRATSRLQTLPPQKGQWYWPYLFDWEEVGVEIGYDTK